MPTDPSLFKDAMARVSSHVSIVTAYDRAGRPRGFTASSMCSLSLAPPLILLCVARAGSSHEIFVRAERFSVSVLAGAHENLATRFARGGDRFAGTGLTVGPHGLTVPGALATLSCTRHTTYAGGDHTILVGRVDDVVVADGDPLIYFNRGFQRLAPAVVGS
jgi:flavin reductase ActVB